MSGVRVTIDAGADDLVQVLLFECRLAVVPGKVEELSDDAIHLFDVRDHAGAGRFVARAHFDAESQTRERRAQIMRDPGQQHCAGSGGGVSPRPTRSTAALRSRSGRAR